MSGEVAILNVGSGDTKISFDPKKPAEAKRAAKIVKDMISRGYAVLIEVGKDDKGPLYRRAYDFDPETAEYIIAGDPIEEESTIAETQPKGASPPPRRRKGKAETKRVPAATAKAVAVPRTAGG